MPIIPSDAPRSLPRFQICCGGTPILIAPELIALDTMQAMDGIGTATLRFAHNPALRDMGAALQLAPLGAVLEVALGYHTALQPVFTGAVRAHCLRFSQTGVPEMVLEATAYSAPAALLDEIVLDVQYGVNLLALEAERTLSDTPFTETQESALIVRGHATLDGTAELRPGVLLAIGGVGDALGGNVRIVAVHHALSRGAWTTRADFSRG